MKLWDLVKSTFEDHPDRTWIQYCDLITDKNNKLLKFKTVFELSELVIQELIKTKQKKPTNREKEGKNRCNIVGLWFDQSSDNILGHFVALVACLRSGHVFFPLDERCSELAWVKNRTGNLASTRSGLSDVDPTRIGLGEVGSSKEKLVPPLPLDIQSENENGVDTQITDKDSKSATLIDKNVKSGEYFAEYLVEDELQPASTVNCGLMMSYKQINSSSRLILRCPTIYLTEIPESSEYPSEEIDNLEYIITTSGSTGNPKRICVTSSSILPNITDIRQAFKVDEKRDCILLGSPLTFDPSIIDIFLSLSSGCRLVVLPNHQKLTHAHNIVSSLGVTILQCTPSLVKLLISSRSDDLKETVRTLRVLAVGGEICSLTVKNILRRLLDYKVDIFHLYGLTEMSVWQSMIKIDEQNIQLMPIYTRNKNLLSEVDIQCLPTLSETDDQSPTKLQLGKQYSTDSIINISSNTRFCYTMEGKNFSPLVTEDFGEWKGPDLCWVGRSDSQIKIHGHKINLHRINIIISNLAQTETVSIKDDGPEIRIVTFVLKTPAIPENIRENEIMNMLRGKLKPQELPAKIVILESFPMNEHNKINTAALTNLIATKSEKTLEEDCVATLKRCWKSLLNIDPVDEHNFISSGGDSFLGVNLLNQINNLHPGKNVHLFQVLIRDTFRDVKLLLTNSEIVTLNEVEPQLHKRLKLDTTNKANHVKDPKYKHIVSKLKGRSSNTEMLNYNSFNLIKNMKHVSFSLKWKVDFEKCIDGSPMYISQGEEKYVVCGSHSGLLKCMWAETGDMKWSTRLPDRIEGSPTLAGSESSTIILVGCYDFKLYAISLMTGQVKWTFQTQAIIKCTPLVMTHKQEEVIIFGGYDHFVYKLDIEGLMRWRTQVRDASVYAAPLCIPSGILISSLDGTVSCLNISTGSCYWHLKLGGPIFANPIYDQVTESFFVGCADCNLYAVSLDGIKLWSIEVGAPIFSSPVIHGRSLVFGCHDSHVYRVNIDSRNISTKTKVSSAVYASVDIVPQTQQVISHAKNQEKEYLILCSTTKGDVYLLSESGSIITRTHLPGNIFSSPLYLHNNSVIIGSRDNYLYSFSIVNDPIK